VTEQRERAYIPYRTKEVMTFKCTTRDPAGNPISGILITANVLETGASFSRSSDGAGYSDVAMELGAAIGNNVLLSVVKEGFQVWTKYLVVSAADQEVSITLSPFAGG